MIPIAYARNGFTDKFGIPRQSLPDSVIETRIVFEPAYRISEALRGIEGYSHLWLLWGFHNNHRKQWSPTVRPPRLGGNRRVGVFATRSPIRPNPIGLTAVRLLRVEQTQQDGSVLVVAGADMQDGTPIFDIKPYIVYADSHPEARSGFVDEVPFPTLQVEGLDQTLAGMGIPPQKIQRWIEILRQDPRPAYQDDPNRVYHITFDHEELTFRVENNHIIVLSVQKI